MCISAHTQRWRNDRGLTYSIHLETSHPLCYVRHEFLLLLAKHAWNACDLRFIYCSTWAGRKISVASSTLYSPRMNSEVAIASAVLASCPNSPFVGAFLYKTDCGVFRVCMCPALGEGFRPPPHTHTFAENLYARIFSVFSATNVRPPPLVVIFRF